MPQASTAAAPARCPDSAPSHLALLARYRATPREQERTASLLGLLPRHRRSVLDIGARDGHFSRLLTHYFPNVTALDLRKPEIDCPGVACVQGDVTCLQFPARSFDCVFCAEVLEHVACLERACREIARVARYEIVLGVPFRQDLRVGRVTCASCGRPGPAWGHLHSFDLPRLQALFPGWKTAAVDFAGSTHSVTNPVSALLMDWAGNPWGSYSQQEPCLHCGSTLAAPPPSRPLWRRACSFTAHRLNQLQARFLHPRPTWIHVLFTA